LKLVIKALTFVLAFMALGFVTACQREPTPRKTPKFELGQIVTFKIDPSIKGMVTYSSCPTVDSRWGCEYTVRVAMNQLSTARRVIGSGGTIKNSPIAKIHGVEEFELEKSQE
jgi:hypothetical protein